MLDFTSLCMILSSANSRHLEFTCSGISLMKARKRIGSSTLPCDTQHVTAASSEHSPYTTTLWDHVLQEGFDPVKQIDISDTGL